MKCPNSVHTRSIDWLQKRFLLNNYYFFLNFRVLDAAFSCSTKFCFRKKKDFFKFLKKSTVDNKRP